MNTTVVQSVAKGALKTGIQTFLAVIIILGGPVLLGWQKVVADGGTIELDATFWGSVLLAAAGGALAALLSYLQNRINAIPS